MKQLESQFNTLFKQDFISFNPYTQAKLMCNVAPHLLWLPMMFITCSIAALSNFTPPLDKETSYVDLGKGEVFVCDRQTCWWATRIVRNEFAISQADALQGFNKRIYGVVILTSAMIQVYYLGLIMLRVLYYYTKFMPRATGEHNRLQTLATDFMAIALASQLLASVVFLASSGLNYAIPEEIRNGQLFDTYNCYSQVYALYETNDLPGLTNALPNGICELNSHATLSQVAFDSATIALNLINILSINYIPVRQFYLDV